MKIAITGSTKGIGRALSKGFSHQGHQIVGFNSQTPGNLSTDEGVNEIVNSIADCDIFVNNAMGDSELRKTCAGFNQTILLYKVWNLWEGKKDKKIITISSRATQTDLGLYSVQKNALDEAVLQLRKRNELHPHIINLKLGFVDTDMTAYTQREKINPSYIFWVCDWIINQSVPIFEITLGTVQK